MLAEIRGSCKQNREFANIAQKCFQNLANKKSVWSLCKVVQTKKTSHKVRGVLLREGLYKAFASCLSSAAVSGFLSSSSIFAASLLYGFSLMCFLHFAFRCRSLRKGFLPHSCGVFRRWHAPHSFGTSCPEVTSGQSVQKLASCGASPAGVFLFGRSFIFQGAAHR